MELRPVGVIRSVLKLREAAPKQGREGAPDAWLEVYAWAALPAALKAEMTPLGWILSAPTAPSKV